MSRTDNVVVEGNHTTTGTVIAPAPATVIVNPAVRDPDVSAPLNDTDAHPGETCRTPVSRDAHVPVAVVDAPESFQASVLIANVCVVPVSFAVFTSSDALRYGR